MIKVDDSVEITKKGLAYIPGTIFKTGRVTYVGISGIRVKRDGYRGHESTWWPYGCWKKM
jgi:hypothetical protein